MNLYSWKTDVSEEHFSSYVEQLENGRFSAQTRGLESQQFILRAILVITFHKLYQQHSERLCLRSSETKSHRHPNIKAFAFLNPCPKLIDVSI